MTQLNTFIHSHKDHSSCNTSDDNVSDHLPIMFSLSCHLSPCPPKVDSPRKPPSLIWDKCSEVQKSAYNSRLRQLLTASPSRLHCCANVHCINESCFTAIQDEYDNLTRQISNADKLLPRHKPGVQKSWWSDELTSLRNKSIDIHQLWISEGRPRSGPTNDERLRVKAAYKREIRLAQRLPKQSCWNRLHGAMISKDTPNFWKSWKNLYNKNRSCLHPVVNGVSDVNAICNSFASHFSRVSKPNNIAQVEKLEADFRQLHHEAVMTHECDCLNHSISLQTVLDAGFSLKKGKTCDDNQIHAEHFVNAPLTLYDRLQLLFNSMLSHAFVPSQFRLGTIIPLVKDRHGDAGNLNNYRGITIAPIISKIFEHVLRIQFHEHLSTSMYQFGFKRKSSTSHAIHSLKETVNYYTHRGSSVYCSFLDASKAFDRLVHAGLFTKLLQRGVPLIFLNLLMFWYADLKCRVRWGETLSEWFDIKAGVRQGGILSPILYCIYVDSLAQILKDAGIGCYIRDSFLSILLYADDMCLMAPSLKGLQRLLKLTENFCAFWDVMLNPKKSKNMQFGKKEDSLPFLQLDGNALEWVDSWTYLGVTLRSHKEFNCCVDKKLQSFYRSANAILRIEGRSDELVMLQLLETHCLSVLSYAIEVISVADRDKCRKLRVAYNSMFRQIFGYRRSESVTDLQHQLGRPTWEELVEKRKTKFLLTVSNL